MKQLKWNFFGRWESDFNEECYYSEENKVTMKTFAPPFLDHFSLSLSRKKRVVMRAMRKKLNIFMRQLPIYYIKEELPWLHIRIGNLDWFKCRHCKSEAREIDCFCCREVDAMLIALAKILGREESVSPFSLYGQLPDC